MVKQLVFILVLLITLGVFAWTLRRIIAFFNLTQPAFQVGDLGKRIALTLKVAIGQSKIFRWPFTGLLHALVFWGFMVITIGSIEMVIDGLTGTERVLAVLGGPVYDVIIGSSDIFAAIVLSSILVFLVRRLFFSISRFKGAEIKKISKVDANIALTMILLLMASLLGMNIGYVAEHAGDFKGVYPVSQKLADVITAGMSPKAVHIFHEVNWWAHILLIFVFANILPYSKHFHVFTSVPNVFLSRLKPLGYLPNMENVMNEVKLMMNPSAATTEAPPISRFGVKDAEDANWKNYFDSLACTECGRCTAVCPANITGKKLSPRKIFMDLRARMKEKGPGLIKNGKEYSDNKSLICDYIAEEELWACTTCNACAQECPININHPTLIVDMRRYLVMEEAAAPAELNMMFTNIENNGAPWQRSQEDRLEWAEGL